MATANISSSSVSDIQVVTSLVIPESNNASTNATAETPASGLFIQPSTVTGRLADITGFLVSSENEYGKLEFSDPDGFLSLGQLSDVTLTTPAANDLLSYDGADWVNVADVTVDSVTLTKGAVTIADLTITTATVNASAGTITVTDGTLLAATRSAELVVTNSAVTATSVISLSVTSGTGEPYGLVVSKGAGTFTLVVYSPITAVGGAAAIDFVVV